MKGTERMGGEFRYIMQFTSDCKNFHLSTATDPLLSVA